MHISRDFISLDGKEYNLSFIITPSAENGGNGTRWNKFFQRITWTTSVPLPQSFYTLDLGNLGKHVYQPCAPFHLNRDEVKEWLTWKKVTIDDATDEAIKMLMFKDGTDAKAVLELEDFKTGISSSIQHEAWATQLATSNRQILTTQEIIKKAISNGLDNITSVICNKIQHEFRNHNPRRYGRRDDDYDRRPYRRADDNSKYHRPIEPQPYQPGMNTPIAAPNPAIQQANQQLAVPQGYWSPTPPNQPHAGIVYTSPQPIQQRNQFSNNQ